MGIKKKAVFFSIDALIAVGIILAVVVAGYMFRTEKQQETLIHYDIISLLSTTQSGELDNTYLQSLIEGGEVSPNKTVLEVIGELYVVNRTRAVTLTQSLLENVETKHNIGIWAGDALIAIKNNTPYEDARNRDIARQFISGIREGEGVTGYTARAFLTTRHQTTQTYFGGYVGDGNITVQTYYSGNITKTELEIAMNTNAEIYVNGILAGNYAASPSVTIPANYTLPTELFRNGTNTVEFRGNKLYIAGGFLKIVYESDIVYEQPSRYKFPGIAGIINLYDGLSIPGALNSMRLSLHYNSPYKTILTIGNISVFNSSSAGETEVTIEDAQLSQMLDYSSLSYKTTPLRLWIENVTFIGGKQSEIDIVLITDVSGSMNWRLDSDSTGTDRNCNDPLLNSSSTKRLSLAKCIDKNFVNAILKASNTSRIALVSFANDANSYTSLTRDAVLLNNTLNSYSASGATCVSCAINRAYNILQTESSNARLKFIIVIQIH